MRLPTALLTLAVLLAPALPAQKSQKTAPPPTRPRLDAGADTNDARSYYRYGMQMVNSKSAESVRAFYWASQIDPSSAEAMYALRTSSLLAMTSSDLFSYFDWSRKKRPPEYLALDSLLYRAYTVNPFVYRIMDLPADASSSGSIMAFRSTTTTGSPAPIAIRPAVRRARRMAGEPFTAAAASFRTCA